MMKLLPLCVLLLCGSLSAQITITTSDFMEADDTVRYSLVTGLTYDDLALDNTGENMNWDYSWLNSSSQEVDSFLTVESAPFAYQFFFNNSWLYPDTYSNLATTAPDIEVGTFAMTNQYTFFNNDDDSYRNTGFGITFSGLPYSVPNDEAEIYFEFPMTYGNSFSNAFETELEIPTLFTWVQQGESSAEVDGWGTLTTPYGTFEVLRQVMLREVTDSTYIDLVGFGTSVPRFPERIYSWVAQDMTAPVMEVTTQEIFGEESVTNVRYQDEFEAEVPDGIEEWGSDQPLFYPNPSNGTLRLKATSPASLYVTVTNLSGRIVFEDWCTPGASVSFDHLAGGTYLATLQSSNGVARQQLVIR